MLIIFSYMCVYIVGIYVFILCVCLVFVKAEEGIKFPGAAVTDGCEPCGFWKLNLGPLKSSQCSWQLSHLSSPMASYFCLLCYLGSRAVRVKQTWVKKTALSRLVTSLIMMRKLKCQSGHCKFNYRRCFALIKNLGSPITGGCLHQRCGVSLPFPLRLFLIHSLDSAQG